MQHPFQCLACIGDKYLVAACGSRIVTHSLETSDKISVWSPEISAPTTTNGNEAENDGERPAKKQKTAKPAPKAPNVIKLTVSPDQRYVVAVTDDKHVRVFQHVDGELTELSQRCMPKRPCAIQVLPDNATILVGDKFGDVYSLPLIETTAKNDEISVVTPEATQPEKVFKPSATNLTVHSQRNLKALEAQQKQKDFTPRKEPLKFQHSLLLGHVSMLTDMNYLLHQSEGKQRGYILTADRDEHIRISRGPPQAYVIEGFCLGHTQFISKICQVGESDLLVSGGGDDWLGVWRWPEGRLVKKMDLISHVWKVLDSVPSDYHLAVSGIWSTETSQGQVVIVACEGVQALFFITRSTLERDAVGDSNQASEVSIVKLSHNLLDVIALNSKIIVSMDGRREGDARLAAYSVESDGNGAVVASIIASDSEQSQWLQGLNSLKSEDGLGDKDLDELLYGVAKLRKRGPLGGDEGGDGNDAPEDE